MSPLVFVIPDGSEEISGGNLYNSQLLTALAGLGPIHTLSVDEFARSPAADAIYLVDTLDLAVAKTVLAQRTPRQRFVLLVHHLPSLEPGRAADHPSRVLEDAVLGQFDGYVATGEFTRHWLAQRGLSERVLLVEPCLPAVLGEDKSFSGPMRALMVCNLIPRKGVLEFLAGVATGLDSLGASGPPDFAIDVVGRSDLDSGYGSACARLVAESEALSRYVSLVGPLPHAQLAARYAAANLFVSASRMETYGMALQEARHHGLPILAVRGGNSEHHLVAGSTGHVFESPAGLSAGLLELVGDSEAHGSLFAAAQHARPLSTPTWDDAAQRLRSAFATWFSGS